MLHKHQIARITIAVLFAPISLFFFKRAAAIKLIIVMAVLITISGCFKNYLKVRPIPISDSTINVSKNSNRSIILFTRSNVYQLINIAANNDQIEADLKPIPLQDKSLIYKIEGRDRVYKHRDKDFLFSQIHLFTNLPDPAEVVHITFPLKEVTKIEVYERDGGKTTLSYVLGGLGVYFATTFVLGIILLSVACNCPQVYTYDGAQYNFKSGVFSGAIYSSLERTDYLPLDGVRPINGQYNFKLANNQKEEQFVNQLQLIQVNHSANTKVLLDRYGKPHTYALTPTLPDNSHLSRPLAQAIEYADGNAYMFNKTLDNHSANGSIVLDFPNKNNNKEAKLIVHAKNSMWSGYIFNEFSGMFGSNYPLWVAKNDKADQQKLEKWQLSQSLPLMVYMQTGKGWEFVDYFPFTGNTAGRDLIMNIPMPTNAGSVKIKIESAYMFWELDYAAMDFTTDEPVNIAYIDPTVATNNHNETKINALAAKDEVYAFLKEDEYLAIEFKNTPETPGKVRSVFLSTTGYYHNTKKYSGKTQTASLYHFKKKGAFNAFSKSKFLIQQEVFAKGIQLPQIDRGQ